jgi:hypothetical protein
MPIQGPIDFLDWLQALPWYHISNLQFNYYTSGELNAGAGSITYGHYLYEHYTRWCERKGFEPSPEVDILGD